MNAPAALASPVDEGELPRPVVIATNSYGAGNP